MTLNKQIENAKQELFDLLDMAGVHPASLAELDAIIDELMEQVREA